MQRTLRSEHLLAFGRTLRRVRRERDLSQEALAAATGLGPKHISELERGKTDPRLTTLLQLAHGLDLRVEDLFETFARELAQRSDMQS